MKVAEYWHGTIKNYRYDGDASTCKIALMVMALYVIARFDASIKL